MSAVHKHCVIPPWLEVRIYLPVEEITYNGNSLTAQCKHVAVVNIFNISK